jgi:hypothetical protein
VDSALSLGSSVLVDEVLEAARSLTTICEPDFVLNLLRVVRGRVKLRVGVKVMVGVRARLHDHM